MVDTLGINRIKVMINGMPLMEMKLPYSTSEEEAVEIAMKDGGIKKYTKGKVMVKSFYAPGYCLSMAFQKPYKGKKHDGVGKKKK